MPHGRKVAKDQLVQPVQVVHMYACPKKYSAVVEVLAVVGRSLAFIRPSDLRSGWQAWAGLAALCNVWFGFLARQIVWSDRPVPSLLTTRLETAISSYNDNVAGMRRIQPYWWSLELYQIRLII